jgi:hypothetical protein
LEYHKTVRRYLVIFMLFLLPIRGLVGDAMAYSMLPAALNSAAAAQATATDIVAAPAIFHWATTLFDHESMVVSGAGKVAAHPCHMATAQADSDDNVQNQCTACQACHLSAATPLQLPSSLLQIATTLPAQRQVLWHSAEPRLIAKTPVF